MRIKSISFALAGLLVAVPAAAVDRLVDDQLVPCWTDPVPIHDTIGDAVAAAVAGEIIVVCPGTYAEHVVVDKDDLTLQAQGLVKLVSPGGSGSGFFVTSDGVTIRGFDVSGFTLVDDCGISVFLPATDASILNNRVHGNFFGICLGAIHTGSQVRNNISELNLSNGLELTRLDDGKVVGNTVRNNGGLGINVSVCVVETTVDHNLVTGNQGGGIFAQACPVVISNNTVRNNAAHGVHALQTGPILVTRNLIQSSADRGLLMEGLSGDCTASLNSMNFNGGPGLELKESDGCTITRNNVRRNGPPDCLWDAQGTHTFVSNSCGSELPPGAFD